MVFFADVAQTLKYEQFVRYDFRLTADDLKQFLIDEGVLSGIPSSIKIVPGYESWFELIPQKGRRGGGYNKIEVSDLGKQKIIALFLDRNKEGYQG